MACISIFRFMTVSYLALAFCRNDTLSKDDKTTKNRNLVLSKGFVDGQADDGYHADLRALMGFHQYDTNFTLEPRTAMNHKNVTRGLGNQVTVEFNLLYRFHCAISRTDEDYLKEFMREALKPEPAEDPPKSVADDPQPSKLRSGAVRSESSSDPSKSKVTSAQSSGEDIDMDNLSMPDFIRIAKKMGAAETKDPSLVEFGLNDSPKHTFKRNLITGLFDDEDMISHLLQKMDDPICESPLHHKSRRH